MELDACQGSGSTLLISYDMGFAFDDDLLARLRMEANGELDGHCAGWHEECRLFPKHRGHHVLEAIDGGIFAVDVVSHVCACHRLAHGLGGFCHGVATQIDHHTSMSTSHGREPRAF